MADPAALYLDLLRREGLEYNVPTNPQIFVSEDESWTNLTVRYLIPSRERRLWSTRMTMAAARELGREEHRGRIRPGFPRLEVEATVDDSPR